jgi:hypothetical protein
VADEELEIGAVIGELRRDIDGEPVRVRRAIERLVHSVEGLRLPGNSHLRPEGIQRILRHELKTKAAILKDAEESEVLFADLAAIGIRVDELSELGSRNVDDRPAIPVLLRWLRRSDTRSTDWEVLGALAGDWTKGEAVGPLIDEFHSIDPASDPEPGGRRWQILDAAQQQASARWKDEFLAIASDPGNAITRHMAIAGLARMRNAKRDLMPVMMTFLNSSDSELYLPAAKALGAWREPAARQRIQELIETADERNAWRDDPGYISWERDELRKALWRILPS